MKKFPLLLWLLPGAITLSPLAGQAQEEGAKPQPPLALVAPVPENAAWKIVLTYQNPDGDGAAAPDKPYAPPGYPTKIETVKTGDAFQFTVTYPDGRVERYDQLGNCIVTPGPGGPKLSVADPEQAPFVAYSIDFFLVDWVRAAGEAARNGTVLRDGIRCYHYQDEAGREAWIDAETLLPVSATDGQHTEASFEFQPSPSAPLVFPPEELAAIAKYQRILKAFNSVR